MLVVVNSPNSLQETEPRNKEVIEGEVAGLV